MERTVSEGLLRESYCPTKRPRASSSDDTVSRRNSGDTATNSMPFSLVLSSTSERVAFGVEGVRIGRDPSCCDVVLSSNHCSRLHCILSVIGGEVCIHDRSSNGTYVNGRRVGPGRCALLKNSDLISLVSPTLPEVRNFSYIFQGNLHSGAAAWPSPLMEGMRRYELGPSIGQGSFAVVRLALNKETGERVAIKIMKRNAFFSETAFTSLHTEVEILRSMDHPNIVRVLDAFAASGTVALVMEYVEGGDLFDYVVGRQRNPFTEEEARYLFVQLVEALLYIHHRKVVHCDLKPENVLVHTKREGRSRRSTPLPHEAGDLFSVADNHQADARSVSPYQVQLKLTDFGIAQYRRGREALGDSGVAIGTHCYAAPEITKLAEEEPSGCVNAAVVTGAADVWSLGVLLHIMCTGSLPKRDPQTTLTILGKDMANMSADCRSIVTLMLAPLPDDRITLANLCGHPWLEGCEVKGRHLAEEDELLSVTATLSPRFGRSLRPSTVIKDCLL